MKSQLQALQREEPTQVFIARRINKLGFSSAEHLRQYFSRYGEVKSVHVSHSRVKSLRCLMTECRHAVHWRLRAAALGFVVMHSIEATTRIILDGPDHSVNGVVVRVHPFHRRNTARALEAELVDDLPLADTGGTGTDGGQIGGWASEEEEEANGSAPVQLASLAGAAEGLTSFADGFPEGFPKGFPLTPNFMYVSEQDLQDAMPASYED